MRAKILMKEFLTHDVLRFIVEKPRKLRFRPGQATEISLKKKGWEKKKRPFTFTNLNEDLVLEFNIKTYSIRNGVTNKLKSIKPGDWIELTEPFGTIEYKGKGTFIAGGAGITPFIAILRDLREKDKIKGNKLIFSNKEQKDVILEKEFLEMFDSENFVRVLTREKKQGYESGRIDKAFLKKHIKNFKGQNFYICGPPKFVEALTEILKALGAGVESIVFEGKE